MYLLILACLCCVVASQEDKLAPEAKIFRDFQRATSVRPLLSMKQWAETRLIIPDGPKKFRRFRSTAQPFTGLWLDLVDSGLWREFMAYGPVQSGKTLLLVIIPLLYHLFETVETVILGVPTKEIGQDKWMIDILPVIEANDEFRRYLPKRGPGSRQSTSIDTIRFGNGAVLKIMTGSAKDGKRSAFTARVLVMTEIDKMAKSLSTSQESDPIHQLKGRTQAYGEDARIFGECSPTTDTGRIVTEVAHGSDTQLAVTCVHCDTPVIVGREHFRGWEKAKNDVEAGRLGHFTCPSCGTVWTNEERKQAARRLVPVHKGQSLEKGVVTGEPEETTCLGFHWSAVHNMFVPDTVIARAEHFAASNPDDEESGEKSVTQQVWGLPYVPEKKEYGITRPSTIMGRVVNRSEDEDLYKGVLPVDTIAVGSGIDLGQRVHHYVRLAERKDGSLLIFDYDVIEIYTDRVGIDRGVYDGLVEAEPLLTTELTTLDDHTVAPGVLGIDSGNFAQKSVYPFCFERPNTVLAMKGWGFQQFGALKYQSPKKDDRNVGLRGLKYHVVWDAEHDIFRCDFDADFYKDLIHHNLALRVGSPGSINLFRVATPRDHLTLAKHLASEQLEQTHSPSGGYKPRRIARYQANHYLDAAAMAYVMLQINKQLKKNKLATPET